MPDILPARGAMLDELEAAIRGAERRVRWCRLVAGLRAALRLDASRARISTHRAEVALASLRRDRCFLLRAGGR